MLIVSGILLLLLKILHKHKNRISNGFANYIIKSEIIVERKKELVKNGKSCK
jgi:hypothetical protein